MTERADRYGPIADDKPAVARGSGARAAPRIAAAALLAGAREIIIEHSNEEYRLRLTSRGKLILTK